MKIFIKIILKIKIKMIFVKKNSIQFICKKFLFTLIYLLNKFIYSNLFLKISKKYIIYIKKTVYF